MDIQPRTQTNKLLNAVRNWHPTHDEAMQFFEVLASSIKTGENGFGDVCRDVVVDFCDECLGQIENDQIAQQAEQAWADNQRRAA